MIDYYQIKQNLSNIDLYIFNQSITGGAVNFSHLAKELNVSRQAIRKRISKLQKYGLIEIVKHNKFLCIKSIITEAYQRQNGVTHRIDYTKISRMKINDMILLDKLYKWLWFAVKENSKIQIMEIDSELYFWVSYRRLSQELEVTYDQIRTSIKNLIKADLIKTKNSGKKVYFYINQGNIWIKKGGK